MAILFSLCAGLQVNDPDPVRWILLYSAAALSSAFVTAERYYAFGALAVAAIAGVWGVYLAVSVWNVISPSDLIDKMGMKGGAVEVGREAGGLLLVAIGLAIAGIFRLRRA
jgi:hypothetical protein